MPSRRGWESHLLPGNKAPARLCCLECLRDSLESSQIHCAFLRDSHISTNRFFQTIAAELDLRCQGTSAYQVFSALHQFTLEQARKGRTVALIVDEAHNLPADVLNEILHLASLHENKVKLLQTVLAGRPELHATLDALNLERLKQRAILGCHLEPFTALETQHYIDFRLAQAGLSAQTIFPPDAIEEIFGRSRGFAPAIHVICEGLLLAAFSARSEVLHPGDTRSSLRESARKGITSRRSRHGGGGRQGRSCPPRRPYGTGGGAGARASCTADGTTAAGFRCKQAIAAASSRSRVRTVGAAPDRSPADVSFVEVRASGRGPSPGLEETDAACRWQPCRREASAGSPDSQPVYHFETSPLQGDRLRRAAPPLQASTVGSQQDGAHRVSIRRSCHRDRLPVYR